MGLFIIFFFLSLVVNSSRLEPEDSFDVISSEDCCVVIVFLEFAFPQMENEKHELNVNLVRCF